LPSGLAEVVGMAGGGELLRPRPPSKISLDALSGEPLTDDWDKENRPHLNSPSKAKTANAAEASPNCQALFDGFKRTSLNSTPVGQQQPIKRPLSLISEANEANIASPDTPVLDNIIKRRCTESTTPSLAVNLVENEKMRQGLFGVGASPDLQPASQSDAHAMMPSPMPGAPPKAHPLLDMASPVSHRGPGGQRQGQGQRIKAGSSFRRFASEAAIPQPAKCNTTPTSRKATVALAAAPSAAASPAKPPPTLMRSYSTTHAEDIKRQLENMVEQPNLAGDHRTTCVLPIVDATSTSTKRKEHRNINCHTLAKLIRGEFDDKVESFVIVDCRYPYEHEGGHISGAVNFGMWNHKQFFKTLLPHEKPLPPLPSLLAKSAASPMGFKSAEEADLAWVNPSRQSLMPPPPPCRSSPPSPSTARAKLGSRQEPELAVKKRKILIFHCEFSSERAPKAMEELRKADRKLNVSSYPNLYHPEIYLLQKGYKEFYTHYPNLCEPRQYVLMKDPRFAEEEKKYHSLSKKAGGGVAGSIARTGSSSRLLKL